MGSEARKPGSRPSSFAAAMATMLPLVEIYNYDLVDVMLITIPASIVGILAMSIVMSRYGKELDDDPEYQRRLAAGESKPPAPAAEVVLQPYAKRSVAIFLTGVLAICVFGFVEGIRPTVAAEGGGVEPMSVTPLIQMIMLTAAALILIFAHVKATEIPLTSIFRSGMVAMIALFGIAWMADTFIANNEDAIVAALGSLAENWPFTIALAIFLVAALTTSQSAATRTMIPLGLALGIGAGYMIAFWTAVAGVLFFPANGTQIAAAEADETAVLPPVKPESAPEPPAAPEEERRSEPEERQDPEAYSSSETTTVTTPLPPEQPRPGDDPSEPIATPPARRGVANAAATPFRVAASANLGHRVRASAEARSA